MARVKIEKNISYDDAKKLYYVNLDFGVVDGKQIKKSKTTKTLPDARKILKEHQADKTKGMLVLPKKLTVEQWLDSWLNDIAIPNNAESTIYGYKNIINQINADLGKIPVQELKAQQVQKYYTKKMNEDKLAANTVIKHYNLLFTALKFAVKQGVININTIERTTPPKKVKPKNTFYTREQLQELLKLIEGNRLEVVAKLGAYYGLRREEIMGLTWKNVDFDNKRIYIKDARTMAGSKVIEKDTKNDSSTRVLHLVDEIEIALQKEKQKQSDNKKYFGEAYHDNDFVIAWEDGSPYRPNYMSELFTKFITDNNLPYLTLHGLRHSFASLSNSLGVSMFDASKLLGHSTPATTGHIYTHMYDDAHVEQSNLIASALSGKVKEKE